MSKYILLILSFLIFQSAFTQKATISSRIDSVINAKTEKPFNGIILISQAGNTDYEKVIGYSNIEKKIPLNWDSYFVIGSISKQITAVLVLQQYEKGKLKPQDVISKYLPQLKQPWANDVTIHQLLAHTHGISELDKPLAFPAGTRYEYSQIGYELLAQIVEKVTGKTFVNVSSELFNECGMHHTFHPAASKISDWVKGYTENENGNLIFDNNVTKYVPAGGFISTAKDMLIWNEHLYGGKLLNNDTYMMMISPKDRAVRNHPVFGMTEYGYGITTEDANGLLRLGQTGYAPGFVSMNFYFPQTKTSIIILENITYDIDNLKKTFYYHSQILDIVEDALSAKQ